MSQEFFVMDGRAIDDTDDAVVFEALGQQRPKMSKLSRDWGEQSACLCVSKNGGPIEFLEVIP